FTEVGMTEVSGRELAQRPLPVRRDLRVLYMPGYPDDAIVRHGVLGAGMAFLSNPFTPDALAARVRELLDSPPAPANLPGPETPAYAQAAAGPPAPRAGGRGAAPRHRAEATRPR